VAQPNPEQRIEGFRCKVRALRAFIRRRVLRRKDGAGTAHPLSARDAETYRLLVSAIGDHAIFLLDADGQVVTSNAGAGALYGYAAGDIEGRHFACFFPEDARSRGWPSHELRAARAAGRFEDEGWRVRQDGTRFWANTVITALRDEAGALCGFAKVTRDITDRRQTREALRQSEERLRRHSDELQATLERMQQAMAIACHELLNPLLPIRTAAALLARKPMDPDSEDLLQTVEGQSALLARFVDDLLAAARIDRPGMSLRRERVSLRDVLHRAVEAARPEIERRGHHLQTLIPHEEIILFADPARLFQVFVNLLNNAARYTPNEGQIRTLVEPGPGQVVVRIEDNGHGIVSEDLHRIFEPFMRAASADQAAPEGLGLGLAVVQRLVHLHAGEVAAESDGLGRGSRFSVTLPRADGLPVAALPATPPQGAQSLRILCVDDDEQVARSLVKLLQAMGHETRMALEGESALHLASGWKPDLVILDLSMPGMSGDVLARKLRAEAHASPPVLVALTGWALEDDGRVHAAGFQRYFMKPVTAEALESAIALARQRVA
jgi:PAS domain S-box-containing protein